MAAAPEECPIIDPMPAHSEPHAASPTDSARAPAPAPAPRAVPISSAATVSLDGRTFRMVSSTTSAVDPENPSEFRYCERDGLVWGEYTGDTVTIGRFVGRREQDWIHISFGHVLVADERVVTGEGRSRIEQGEDGALRLVEHYEMHGEPQLSVCREVI